MARQPMRHVLRTAIPWQPPRPVTECGRTPTPSLNLIDRALAIELTNTWIRARQAAKQAGVDGAAGGLAPDICGTCIEKMRNWMPWHIDPVAALERDLRDYTGTMAGEADVRVRAELWALAELVSQDPDRYARLVEQHTADALDRHRYSGSIALQGRAAR